MSEDKRLFRVFPAGSPAFSAPGRPEIEVGMDAAIEAAKLCVKEWGHDAWVLPLAAIVSRIDGFVVTSSEPKP